MFIDCTFKMSDISRAQMRSEQFTWRQSRTSELPIYSRSELVKKSVLESASYDMRSIEVTWTHDSYKTNS